MVSLSSCFETTPDLSVSKHIKFVVRKVWLGLKLTLGASRLTNCSRGIRNAWHFHYALVLVVKVVAGAWVLRCSPLNCALALFEEVIWKSYKK